MRHAGAARRELGVPTFFNFLGPLTNPARVQAAARADKSSNMPWIIGIGVMLVIGIALMVLVTSINSKLTARRLAPKAGDICCAPSTTRPALSRGILACR